MNSEFFMLVQTAGNTSKKGVSILQDAVAGRKNKAFLTIKHALDDREREKKKRGPSNNKFEQTMYVDTQRNVAVVMGERDVKVDGKAKIKRDARPARIGNAVLTAEDECDALVAQVMLL